MTKHSRATDKVFLRVDASGKIGYGHLMRCLTLYKEAHKYKFDAILLVNEIDDFVTYFLDKGNYSYILLDQLIAEQSNNSIAKLDACIIFDIEYAGVSQIEYDQVLTVFSNQSYSLAFADFTKPWNVKGIDNMILPYVGADTIDIPFWQHKNFMGPNYFVLKQGITKYIGKYKVNSVVKTIVVTMGGSNINNSVENAIKIILSSEFNGNVKVLVGGSAIINFDLIHHMLKKSDVQVELIYNAKDFDAEFFNSDIVFTNDGLTKYESLAIGIPTVAITSSAENIQVMDLFEKRTKAIVNFGVFEEKQLAYYTQHLQKIVASHETRKAYSEAGKKVITGNGSALLLDDILKCWYGKE